ncbi:putative two-component sensor kinase [Streptomyces ambofaciens ATCC 23877]|uniref:histidine kinase n=1 Tax=Streptomyces ambofaciens (strain ATCC 23877 / 3486 / DSM 40053 / JCM 4204 / NBRC 12836 / NRRL B-2516) TaxID=278992 RepID=A0A0K2AZ65_STRA7|nr:HAMP domain-containing sensor histidine kinase [Streptomyces ambofaciens]AKZ58196.1 putative two-component sensor kinase [Streptomyces ambofaciens ATCC 23877]
MSRLLGSVRARATLGATLVVAVALVAAGTAVLLSLRSNLLGEAGTQAERSAREVATELAVGTPYGELSLDVDDRPVQIVDEDGTLVAASEDLERISGTSVGAVQPQPAATGDGGDGDDDGGDTDEDDSGESLEPGEIGERTTVSDGSATIDGDPEDYRFAAVPVETREQGRLTVWAGAPLSAEHGAVNTALTVMLIGFPLLLAVVGWVTWMVTGRALRPVEGIRREMAAITASEDLARRVPVPGTHDEVARLASTTNETLSALEASVDRQRRFVADASHELRSPIASLRTQLEVAAAHPELLDLDGAVEDTVRLQRLAADLLLLARLDAGERPADARVDLAALAREEAGARVGVRVRAGEEGEGEVTVAGSRGQLGRVLANLLDNAQRHARSAVEVSVRRDGELAVLAVADDGEGVPAADRERIFERFVRLDAARSRDDGGAGLGLAIARDVAVRHGGTLTVHDAPAGGALFELRLPGTA